jgi:hypothetical protein
MKPSNCQNSFSDTPILNVGKRQIKNEVAWMKIYLLVSRGRDLQFAINSRARNQKGDREFESPLRSSNESIQNPGIGLEFSAAASQNK